MKYLPELVVLEGDDQLYDVLMGIDDCDRQNILNGDISEYDYHYYVSKYPELMGVWTAILKLAKGVGKGVVRVGRGIGGRIRARRAARKAAESEAKQRQFEQQRVEQQRQLQQAAIAAQIQQQRAAAEQNSKNMIVLAGLGAIPLFLMLMKKK